MPADRLPSWRPGATRDAILEFLDGTGDVPVEERVAYLDNDGTMWCEKPQYVQLEFLVDALQRGTEADPLALGDHQPAASSQAGAPGAGNADGRRARDGPRPRLARA